MNYFILLKCYEKTKANFIHSLKHLLTCFLRHNFKFLMVDVDVLFTDVNVLFIKGYKYCYLNIYYYYYYYYFIKIFYKLKLNFVHKSR